VSRWLFALVLLWVTAASAQEKGTLPYCQLKWTDFRIDDAHDNDHRAFTYVGMSYTYKFRYAKSGSHHTAVLTDFRLWSFFDQAKSWRKTNAANSPPLLKHEQGPFDLNEILVRATLARPPSDYPIGYGASKEKAAENLKQKLHNFVTAVRGQVENLTKLYDESTNGHRNAVVQAKWNAYFEARLKDPIGVFDTPA
jgi:hypothetical protein